MATKTLCDTDSTQTLTNKTLTAPVLTAAAVALAASPVNTLDAATKGYVDGLNVNPLNNGSLAVTVASNAMTVHLKTAGGAVPSASDPVRITFRHATDTDGSLTTRTVTGATTMTFASGSSMGMSNGVAARLWVGLLDNSGTVEVCAWNPYSTASSANSLKGFIPNTDVTTTAEGSGTATLAHTLYSTNARSTVPFVLLGFIEITEATAGVWATSPTVVQTFRDGYRKTGEIIQIARIQTGAMATGTTTIPIDDTIPQISEGDQYMTVSITASSAINLLRASAQAWASWNVNSGAGWTAALFQGGAANAIAAGKELYTDPGVSTHLRNIPLQTTVLAGSVSSQAFACRVGGASAGTITFNGQSGARIYGGVIVSYVEVMEVMV